MHRIYIAAIMSYSLGSDDPDKLAYYNEIRKEMGKKTEPIRKWKPFN